VARDGLVEPAPGEGDLEGELGLLGLGGGDAVGVLLVAAGAAHALGEVEADRGGRAPELIGERGGPRLQLHAQRLQRAEEIEDEKLGIEHVVGSVVGVRPSATDAHGP
jgi:hypothetical protein